MNRLNSFFSDYSFLLMTALFILYIIFRVFKLSRKCNWHSSVWHELSAFLLFSSLVWIAYMTIAPPWNIDGVQRLNLQIFKVIKISIRYWKNHRSDYYFFVNLIGNIAIFIPVGFFIPLTFRIHPGRCILIGFAMSLFIEVLQYPIGRWSDIDDLWLNTLGTALGVLLYVGCRAAAPNVIKKFNVHWEKTS